LISRRLPAGLPPVYPLLEDTVDRQQAVQEAARAVIEHGGPHCLTDPHIPLNAMGAALDAGATHDDIAAEMQRQRNA
jgi:hypothetical protein